MLTCHEFTNNVTAYMDGVITGGPRVGMWFHAMTCGHCRRYLRQMRDVVELTGHLPDLDTIDPECPDDLKARLIQEWRAEHSPSAGE